MSQADSASYHQFPPSVTIFFDVVTKRLSRFALSLLGFRLASRLLPKPALGPILSYVTAFNDIDIHLLTLEGIQAFLAAILKTSCQKGKRRVATEPSAGNSCPIAVGSPGTTQIGRVRHEILFAKGLNEQPLEALATLVGSDEFKKKGNRGDDEMITLETGFDKGHDSSS
eukprot:CAMPEP_0178813684 /NCGR_PEP_ID=MMETSP0745-20121128/20491_1 /TAXON_ID=913974 /ORGANISM="Nitzschia punctata, Strain CCMP561" /LENGTH=169 /DNA_ID=CAMNT_0020474561 /DNA_START=46 /DNA_END=552 /DNA_ORIENTATION=+